MTPRWSLLRKACFQFTFCYLVLYSLPVTGRASPLDILPWGSGEISSLLFWPMRHLTEWVGTHLFHLTGVASAWHPTGSGDTALDWVNFACNLVLALIAAAIWHVLDRRRENYRALDAWFRLALSIVLGLAMLEYGFAKVFPAQFGPPGVVALNETYGDSSPMRLLWTFMGYSTGYTFLAGLGEVAGGLLLLFRRTRTAGALLSGAILLNVFMLNMFYDVPVKIYSFHLLAMVGILLLPDLRALFGLLFLRKQVQLRTDAVPASERRWLRISARIAQAALLLLAVWSFGYGTYASRETPPARGPLFGMWSIDPSTPGTAHPDWKRIYITSGEKLSVVRNDNERVSFPLASANAPENHAGKDHFRYTAAPNAHPQRLDLAGTLSGAPITMTLVRTSPDKYLLESQGFHWTHEFPPNF